MELHPDLEPVAWLLGRWDGEGHGEYPTIEPFAYRETATWRHGGKPLLAYSQATWATDDGRPLHGESGFLRAAGGRAELVLAHGNGFVEIAIGELAHPLVLTSVTLTPTPSAKDVTAIDRRWWLEDGVLHYELGMAAVGRPRALHLEARLRQ
jgi:hypothetical protein